MGRFERFMYYYTWLIWPKRLREFLRRHHKGYAIYIVLSWVVTYFTLDRQINWWSRRLDWVLARMSGVPTPEPFRISDDTMSYLEDYAVQADLLGYHEYCAEHNISAMFQSSVEKWEEYLAKAGVVGLALDAEEGSAW